MSHEDIRKVIRTVGAGKPHTFTGSEQTQHVVIACDGGLCRLVLYDPAKHFAVLHDEGWNIDTGIELTPRGEEFLKKIGSVVRH